MADQNLDKRANRKANDQEVNNGAAKRRTSILKTAEPVVGGGGSDDTTMTTGVKRRVSFHAKPRVQVFEKPSSNFSESENPTPHTSVDEGTSKSNRRSSIGQQFGDTTLAVMDQTAALFDVVDKQQKQKAIPAEAKKQRVPLAKLKGVSQRSSSRQSMLPLGDTTMAALDKTSALFDAVERVSAKNPQMGSTPLSRNQQFGSRLSSFSITALATARCSVAGGSGSTQPSPVPSPLPSGFLDDTQGVFNFIQPKAAELAQQNELAPTGDDAAGEAMEMDQPAEQKRIGSSSDESIGQEEGNDEDGDDDSSVSLGKTLRLSDSDSDGRGAIGSPTFPIANPSNSNEDNRPNFGTPNIPIHKNNDGSPLAHDPVFISPANLSLTRAGGDNLFSGIISDGGTPTGPLGDDAFGVTMTIQQAAEDQVSSPEPQQELDQSDHESVLEMSNMSLEEHTETTQTHRYPTTPTHLLKIDGVEKYGDGAVKHNQSRKNVMEQYTPFNVRMAEFGHNQEVALVEDDDLQESMVLRLGDTFTVEGTEQQQPIGGGATLLFDDGSPSPTIPGPSSSATRVISRAPPPQIELPMAHLNDEEFEQYIDAEWDDLLPQLLEARERRNEAYRQYHHAEMARMDRMLEVLRQIKQFKREREADERRVRAQREEFKRKDAELAQKVADIDKKLASGE